MINRKINNVTNILENCTSAWAINYWTCILSYLRREAERGN